MHSTGMGLGELVGLAWEDIDFEGRWCMNQI
jgi:integrase